jgi:hypothetical protein
MASGRHATISKLILKKKVVNVCTGIIWLEIWCSCDASRAKNAENLVTS